MIKLSAASKMPCKSWSLQAIATCPGARDDTGALVPACDGCYATGGNYRFPNVKAPRIHNQEDWRRDAWAPDMIAELSGQDYFRWFDSGDVYHIELARKILDVMRATPNTKHWLPTRMHKFAKFRPVLAAMQRLPNVCVRRSSDSITGGRVRGRNSSTIVGDSSQLGDAVLCGAYTRDGKCGDCRACWDPTIPVIAYPGHSRKMLSLIAKG